MYDSFGIPRCIFEGYTGGFLDKIVQNVDCFPGSWRVMRSVILMRPAKNQGTQLSKTSSGGTDRRGQDIWEA